MHLSSQRGRNLPKQTGQLSEIRPHIQIHQPPRLCGRLGDSQPSYAIAEGKRIGSGLVDEQVRQDRWAVSS